MIQVTADVFSGRPNPTWEIADASEIRSALSELASNRGLLDSRAAALDGLGQLRGFHIDIHSDETAAEFDLGTSVFVPLSADRGDGRLHALAERLIGLASANGVAAGAAARGVQAAQVIAHADLQTFLRDKLSRETGTTAPDSNRSAEAEAASAQETAAVTCMVEFGAYNPGFWNNDATVRTRNNCYNYASNKRTNTFAQPGRGSGHIYTAITCPAVSKAALSDGLHQRFVCFPDSEKPRYLVALVVAPGPGFVDFHWYRKNSEGFWSHKPGGTAVRNVDNSNRIITDPATCNRGPYTQFCGYFYTCKSQRIN
jgi:hypothetical protein